jgi:hypothetical protein
MVCRLFQIAVGLKVTAVVDQQISPRSPQSSLLPVDMDFEVRTFNLLNM